MAVKFFGQFLVEHDAITNESLLRAIELQEKTNLKLGEMAVAMGFITREKIEAAHTAQLSRDMKLGDLLQDMGFLSREQLEEVVARQKATHLYIGEALVKVGALTPDKLEKYLEDFKADQAPYIIQSVELPGWLNQHRQVWEMMVDLTCKMITRVLGLQFRMGRFTEECLVGANKMVAAMNIKGDLSCSYMFAVTDEVRNTIARAILREDDVAEEPVEVLDDSVMEFVNIVCGNVVAKGSQMGLELDIEPPRSYHPGDQPLPLPQGYRALQFPFYLNNNETMELALFIRQ